ncbi:MAG: hypothetical protein Q9220_007760 [cf. Caloplaca sp. 1 TL-2023]
MAGIEIDPEYWDSLPSHGLEPIASGQVIFETGVKYCTDPELVRRAAGRVDHSVLVARCQRLPNFRPEFVPRAGQLFVGAVVIGAVYYLGRRLLPIHQPEAIDPPEPKQPPAGQDALISPPLLGLSSGKRPAPSSDSADIQTIQYGRPKRLKSAISERLSNCSDETKPSDEKGNSGGDLQGKDSGCDLKGGKSGYDLKGGESGCDVKGAKSGIDVEGGSESDVEEESESDVTEESESEESGSDDEEESESDIEGDSGCCRHLLPVKGPEIE